MSLLGFAACSGQAGPPEGVSIPLTAAVTAKPTATPSPKPVTIVPPGPVSFFPAGGTFSGQLQIRLQPKTAATPIHFTLDGTPPTAASPLYEGPIVVNTSTVVRTFSPTEDGPQRAGQSYLALAPDAAPFTSNLPLVIVQRHGSQPLDPHSNDLVAASLLTLSPGASGRSTLLGEATLSNRAGIRVRGQSSRGFPQKSYTVEFWQPDVNDDQALPWLDMPANSDWVLLAPSQMDRSLVRTMLPMDLSRELGRYAPRTRLVEVFFIDSQSPQPLSMNNYVGVYTAMEKIKRGSERIPVSKLAVTDSTDPAVTGGYILRIDHEAKDFNIHGYDFGWVYPNYNLMTRQEWIPQNQYIQQYLQQFLDALHSPEFRHPQSGQHYSSFIDTAQWIDHNWINALTKNVDALRLSAYFYKQRQGPLIAGPVWDFDRSMGTPHDERATRAQEWSSGDGTHPMQWGFWKRLFEDPNFAAAYWDRWAELREGPFSLDSILRRLDEYEAQVREARQRHFARWTELPPVGGPEGEMALLRTWFRARLIWLDAQVPSR